MEAFGASYAAAGTDGEMATSTTRRQKRMLVLYQEMSVEIWHIRKNRVMATTCAVRFKSGKNGVRVVLDAHTSLCAASRSSAICS